MATPLRVLDSRRQSLRRRAGAARTAPGRLRSDRRRVETEQDYRDHLQPAPEIILADFSMPEFDSLRALEIMQERQLDIPFIIVSGTIGEERAVQVMQRGATDYIIKDRLGRLGRPSSRRWRWQLKDEKLKAEQTVARLAAIVETSGDAIIDQDSRRHHHQLESGRRKPLRLFRAGDPRQAHLDSLSARPPAIGRARRVCRTFCSGLDRGSISPPLRRCASARMGGGSRCFSAFRPFATPREP